MSTQLDGRGYSIRPFFLLSHLLPFPSLFSFFYQSDMQTLQSSKKALGKISTRFLSTQREALPCTPRLNSKSQQLGLKVCATVSDWCVCV